MIQAEQILNARILLIEDDKTSRLLLKGILHSGGFKNIRALPNATRIAKIYASYRPDLLILDLDLPKITGFDVMSFLRLAYPDDYLPILVISADIHDSVQLRVLSSGAKDFLNKPYDRPKVLLRCRNVIETKLLHSEVKAQNRDLERLVHERTQELHKSRLDVIRRLGYAAEFRDTDTGIHIVRMSRYCEALARAVGLSDEECELILHTSPLHDIGKIAIPDSILRKPGALTAEEFDHMKFHASIGGDLLSGSESAFLKMAETIARTHHEKWDGTGYPNGLKGEGIPLVGRICAICDVFDALTSERPYKKAWTVEGAVKEIKKMSGTNFDPQLVSIFMSILPKIKTITKEVAVIFKDNDPHGHSPRAIHP